MDSTVTHMAVSFLRDMAPLLEMIVVIGLVAILIRLIEKL